jgi:iron complex transport system ATP-binding protein
VTVLSALGVSYRIGTATLVDAVDLLVEGGELIALTGPNGAGKSTLLALLAGDLDATEGAIELNGRQIGSLGTRELALERAVMPQEAVIEFPFSVREVVEMGRAPHRRNPEGDAVAVARAIRAADLDGLSQRAIPTLSGGERQRASLARVLAQETRILLLDEPTASLDIPHQEHAMRIARSLADGGGTVVAVLHDLNLAAAYADRLALMDCGRVVACGKPDDVLSESTLAAVFGHPFICTTSPSGGPLVVPARGVAYADYAATRT